MIVKIDKKNYLLVISDVGKRIRVVGEKETYSQATELKDHPRKYEEVD